MIVKALVDVISPPLTAMSPVVIISPSESTRNFSMPAIAIPNKASLVSAVVGFIKTEEFAIISVNGLYVNTA